MSSPKRSVPPSPTSAPDQKRIRLNVGSPAEPIVEVEGASAVELASAPGKDKEKAPIEGTAIENISMGVDGLEGTQQAGQSSMAGCWMRRVWAWMSSS